MTPGDCDDGRGGTGGGDEGGAVEVAVVERLDGNAHNEKGQYQCKVRGCGWAAANAHWLTPGKHVKKMHPGLKLNLVRTMKDWKGKRPTVSQEEEERKAYESAKNKKAYQARKVRPGLILCCRCTYI